jgi:EAL domain-containing protein (putative c-di-GMP-specific phosphodiesterase class I)
LDDFGAGGSALAWLRQLPLDALKLHPSFVNAVDEESTRAVVRAVVALAATLGLRTVAEGVETPEQLAVLRDVGCDETQGFLHARPLPEVELTSLLAARRSLAV